VAVSDPTGVFAEPLETLEHRGLGDRRLLDRIEACALEYEIGRIVIGLPLHMNGSRGPEAERAERFGARVAERTKLPVEFVDERWTTLEAERAFQSLGVRKTRRKQQVDAVAASLILRTYLERREAP